MYVWPACHAIHIKYHDATTHCKVDREAEFEFNDKDAQGHTQIQSACILAILIKMGGISRQ